jgi:hypothetical protein
VEWLDDDGWSEVEIQFRVPNLDCPVFKILDYLVVIARRFGQGGDGLAARALTQTIDS